MKIICMIFGHKWGPSIPWSTYTIEVPFEGNFLVHRCKRCRVQRVVPGSRTGPGRYYVPANPASEQHARNVLNGDV